MSKPPPKGAVGTPTQARQSGGNTRQTRATTAAATANKQAENKSQPKAAASKNTACSSEGADVAVAPQAPKRNDTTSSHLHKIVSMLTQVIREDVLDANAKQHLEEIIIWALEKAGSETGEDIEQCKVSAIREAIQADLVQMHNALVSHINGVQESMNVTLANTSRILKDAEDTRETAKDLIGKVSKVSETANRLASETSSYRDVLLASPKHANRQNTDPKVLNDMDRKAKQIMVEIFDTEGNNTLAKSLAELVERANKAIETINDADKPKGIKVVSAFKTRSHALLLTLDSKEAVNWLREVSNEIAFTEAFSEGSHIKERAYNLIVPHVPIVFEPKKVELLREVEEANEMGKNSIRRVKWIKPENRRRPDQTHAYAIFSITSVDDANRLIRDGLIINGAKVRPKKQKQEPIQCMRCRLWGHLATECKAEKEACGACGEAHRTGTCSNKGKKYCVSCKDNTHPSWDRNCPEFIRRCVIHDERNPENALPYFPTEHDWTLTARPERIPIDERFPGKYAVNSLPIAGHKHPGQAPKDMRRKQGQNMQKGHGRRGVAEKSDRENPNLIPINRCRETGELPADEDTWEPEPECTPSELENTDEAYTRKLVSGWD